MECDVRMTRDGHLVCVHDRTVNRTSDGHGVVSDLDLDGLNSLNFSSWHSDLPSSA
ncbi:MAG: glycerophosphoryl diester phosphodiesterase, partial [Pseudonocardiales bacterium]|nr:glycerophosphoryl diester phosphodiesterase [Pseudonocardiales bacterium]